jgi:hypothetical protein
MAFTGEEKMKGCRPKLFGAKENKVSNRTDKPSCNTGWFRSSLLKSFCSLFVSFWIVVLMALAVRLMYSNILFLNAMIHPSFAYSREKKCIYSFGC